MHYAGEKAEDGDAWRHSKITLKPIHPAFAPIVLHDVREDDALQVIAELVEVLAIPVPDSSARVLAE